MGGEIDGGHIASPPIMSPSTPYVTLSDRIRDSTTSTQPSQQEATKKKELWWMDWFCGCGEEKEHEGQAGRTNPME